MFLHFLTEKAHIQGLGPSLPITRFTVGGHFSSHRCDTFCSNPAYFPYGGWPGCAEWCTLLIKDVRKVVTPFWV